ncbi:MAG: EscI/YscI/HrpB family type III secretion system inner rod protein [Comamonadaceae bacterium]|nr:MAG: EscI/YscI/HrpB family type III secretion system inner rod protein [Comamonadaceae bacterium]
MAGEIISIVAQATTQPGWADSPVMSSVSENDAARFSDLVSKPQAREVQPLQPGNAVNEAAPVSGQVNAAGNSLGDRMLKTFDTLGKQYKEGAGSIDKAIAVEGASMTPTTALRLQVEMFRMSMHVDLMSKFTAKTGQHVDTLTKLQ